MKTLSKTICIARWKACIMLAMTGYAFGNILAKSASAFGF